MGRKIENIGSGLIFTSAVAFAGWKSGEAVANVFNSDDNFLFELGGAGIFILGFLRFLYAMGDSAYKMGQNEAKERQEFNSLNG